MMVIVRKWRLQSAADKLVTQTWVVFLLLVLVSGTLGAVLVTNQTHNVREDQAKAQQNSDLQCIANWANATNHRSTILSGLSNLRAKAQRHEADAAHDALDYALTHPNGDAAEIAKEIGFLQAWNLTESAYQKADDNYTQAIKSNPVPPAVFTCSERLHSKMKAKVTPSPSPSSSHS